MQKYTLQPSRCAGKGGVWICLLVLILICIGMHSVKSETKCMTTIGTVNSRLARTPAIRTSAKFPFYCRLLLSNKDTNFMSGWELHFQC